MNEIVEEWIAKAEEDHRAAVRMHRFYLDPTPNVVCFLAQQCAEKYLKAFLIQQAVPFRWIHDLEELLGLITPLSPEFEAIRDQLLILNDYAVDVRYPGESATQQEATEAAEAMKIVRAFMKLVPNAVLRGGLSGASRYGC